MKLSEKQKGIIRLMRTSHPRMGEFYSGNQPHVSIYSNMYEVCSIRVHAGVAHSLMNKRIVESKFINGSSDYYLTKLGKEIKL